MNPSTINTTSQIALICLGFVAFFIEFISDRFSKGKALHNALRAAKLLTALFVAAFGAVSYHYGNVLSRQGTTELSAATNSLAIANQRISELSEAAPRIDKTGRIVAAPGVFYASEFTDGVSRAKALFTQGQFADAFAEAERLSKTKPDFGLAYFIMGTVRTQEGQYVEGQTLLTKAISFGLAESDLAWAYHNLGIAAVRQGENLKAKGYFESAIKADPNMKESADMLRMMGFPTR